MYNTPRNQAAELNRNYRIILSKLPILAIIESQVGC